MFETVTDMIGVLDGFGLPEKGNVKSAVRRSNIGGRPFVAWDGEGITFPGNVEQSYVLFGASTGDRLTGKDLGTAALLNHLLAVERKHGDAIHVGFAISYDANMILKDVPLKSLHYLYRHNRITWEGYKLEFLPGKWFSVKKAGLFAKVFDVWGFFQSSFVTACQKFLGENDPELASVIEGKKARNSFKFEELETFIVPYWQAELRLLVRLMDSLRDDLLAAGLALKSWHGPGAVANVVLRNHGVQLAKQHPSEIINRCAQYGYAGGRFELFQAGHHDRPVFQYDIRSAYPTAIAELPNLCGATWRKAEQFEPDSFGIWHVRFTAPEQADRLFVDPQPVVFRDRNGNTSFPVEVENWVWTPEAAIVPKAVISGWVLDHDNSKPFGFVHDLYEQRNRWKQEGNSAEKALKLALNSLYGKMAQRAGWHDGEDLPKWHQLEWAGYVTSATRAKLWHAISLNPNAVIAVETDAVFSTERLPLDLGEGLGQWELSEYDWITYLQSGFYYAGQGSKLIEKYRGFDKGSLPYDTVKQWLKGNGQIPLVGSTTRFIGLGLGLHTRATWRAWETSDRSVMFGGGGKRAHVAAVCPACRQGAGLGDCLHRLTVVTAGGRSAPHALPWLADSEPRLRLLDNLELF